MFLSIHRLFAAVGSTVLAVGLFTPPAPAQMFHTMATTSVQSSRSSGMTHPLSLNQRLNLLYMSRFGMYPGLSTGLGYGQNSISPYMGGYIMPPVPPVGSYGASPSLQYGLQPGQMSTYNQLPPQGDGYGSTSSSAEMKTSPQAAAKSQLKSLRLFAGGLSWPRALHNFTNDGNLKELREGIDAQVEKLLTQQDGKSVPADIVGGLKKDIEKLRKRFVAQSYDLPMTSQQEADARRFLRQLSSALEQFSTTTAASKSQ